MVMVVMLSGVGLAVAMWIYVKTTNTRLAYSVFFFFTMEFLQGLQYLVIAPSIDSPECDNMWNKALTVLGYLHICAQPYFCHSISMALTKNAVLKTRYNMILRMCVLGGIFLFIRFLLGYYPAFNTQNVGYDNVADLPVSTEWLRGEKLCTFNGRFHLAWSVPMADPSYFIQGVGLHSFLMYAPFLAMYEKKVNIVQGLFLLLTGPILASYISPNLMEQASIWCFFSIMQISTMLFLIRKVLIEHWGRGVKPVEKETEVVAKTEKSSRPQRVAAKKAL